MEDLEESAFGETHSPLPPETPAPEPRSCLLEAEALEGIALWALLENFQRWVHRRVEAIEVLDRTHVRRRVSVDLTIQLEDFEGFEEEDLNAALPAIPLTFLEKTVLKRFDLRDAHGDAVPVLTKDETNRLTGHALVQSVESLLQSRALQYGQPIKPLPSSVEHEVRAVVTGNGAEALSIVAGWEHKARADSGDPDQELWDAIVTNEAIMVAARTLSEYFVLLAAAPASPGKRRIFKFAYNDVFELSGERRVATRTGWQVERLFFEAPTVALSESYHLELLGIEELTFLDAAMHFTVEGETVATEPPDALEPDVHFNQHRVDRSRQARVEVPVRASRTGFVMGAAFVAAVGALLLLLSEFRLAQVSDNDQSQVTAALLLLAPAVFGALVIRPGEHRLATRLLTGVRALVLANLGAAVVAVGALAGDLKGASLRCIWTAAFVVALIAAVGLARPVLWPVGGGGPSTRRRRRRVLLECVTVRVADLTRSWAFYDSALGPLGATSRCSDAGIVYRREGDDELKLVEAAKPDGPTGLTFVARNREQVQAFYCGALAAGGTGKQPPGLILEEGRGKRYAASVLDPDGNDLVAIFRLDAA